MHINAENGGSYIYINSSSSGVTYLTGPSFNVPANRTQYCLSFYYLVASSPFDRSTTLQVFTTRDGTGSAGAGAATTAAGAGTGPGRTRPEWIRRNMAGTSGAWQKAEVSFELTGSPLRVAFAVEFNRMSVAEQQINRSLAIDDISVVQGQCSGGRFSIGCFVVAL